MAYIKKQKIENVLDISNKYHSYYFVEYVDKFGNKTILNESDAGGVWWPHEDPDCITNFVSPNTDDSINGFAELNHVLNYFGHRFEVRQSTPSAEFSGTQLSSFSISSANYFAVYVKMENIFWDLGEDVEINGMIDQITVSINFAGGLNFTGYWLPSSISTAAQSSSGVWADGPTTSASNQMRMYVPNNAQGVLIYFYPNTSLYQWTATAAQGTAFFKITIATASEQYQSEYHEIEFGTTTATRFIVLDDVDGLDWEAVAMANKSDVVYNLTFTDPTTSVSKTIALQLYKPPTVTMTGITMYIDDDSNVSNVALYSTSVPSKYNRSASYIKVMASYSDGTTAEVPLGGIKFYNDAGSLLSTISLNSNNQLVYSTSSFFEGFHVRYNGLVSNKVNAYINCGLGYVHTGDSNQYVYTSYSRQLLSDTFTIYVCSLTDGSSYAGSAAHYKFITSTTPSWSIISSPSNEAFNNAFVALTNNTNSVSCTVGLTLNPNQATPEYCDIEQVQINLSYLGMPMFNNANMYSEYYVSNSTLYIDMPSRVRNSSSVTINGLFAYYDIGYEEQIINVNSAEFQVDYGSITKSGNTVTYNAPSVGQNTDEITIVYPSSSATNHIWASKAITLYSDSTSSTHEVVFNGTCYINGYSIKYHGSDVSVPASWMEILDLTTNTYLVRNGNCATNVLYRGAGVFDISIVNINGHTIRLGVADSGVECMDSSYNVISSGAYNFVDNDNDETDPLFTLTSSGYSSFRLKVYEVI